MTRTVRDLLIQAVTEISDEVTQQRLWVRGERQSENECGWDDAILVVIDELETRNPPTGMQDYALANEEELAAFQRLEAACNTLLRQIGPRGTFQAARSTGPIWTECVDSARALRKLMLADPAHH